MQGLQPSCAVGRVLVVDDEERNRLLLRDLLEPGGHEVIEADGGEAALRHVQEQRPDVVLLDLRMPGMDGFEVCRRIKGEPQTAHLPVLIITALSSRTDRLAGIDAGANDFITKPIDTQDVCLRVRNAIITKKIFEELQGSYARLQNLEAMRDTLTQMVVHDLRSPVAGLVSYISSLRKSAADTLGERDLVILERAHRVSRSLVDMISSVLDVSRLESGQMPLDLQECDLAEVVDAALEAVSGGAWGDRLEYGPPGTPVIACCDPEVLRRVVVNLLDNAWKFTPAPGIIRIDLFLSQGQPVVSVSDTGCGIPPEHLDGVFDKFRQVAATNAGHKYSSGLGLTFCRLAIEAHQGQIGVDSEVGTGSTFWFTLPAAAPARAGAQAA